MLETQVLPTNQSRTWERLPAILAQLQKGQLLVRNLFHNPGDPVTTEKIHYSRPPGLLGPVLLAS